MALLEESHEIALGGRKVLLALDAALGLPVAAWNEALDLEPEGTRPATFPDWLRLRSADEIGRKVSRPEDWSPRSPFLTLPQGERLGPFVDAVGLERLQRLVEVHAGANLPFVSGLPGFVGATSQSVWCELIARLEGRDWGFWPFDGSVGAILQSCGTVLAEAYPAVLYRVVVPGRPAPRKSSGRSRAEWLDALDECDWIREKDIERRDIVAAEVNENEFDSCVTAMALLRLVLEEATLESNWDDAVSEGGILALETALGF